MLISFHTSKIIYERSMSIDTESFEVLIYMKTQAWILNFKMNDFMRICFEKTQVQKFDTPSGYYKHRLNDTQIVRTFYEPSYSAQIL